MVAILMKSEKFATLGLLKIKVFWNKGYDIIVSYMMSPPKFDYMTQIIL